MGFIIFYNHFFKHVINELWIGKTSLEDLKTKMEVFDIF